MKKILLLGFFCFMIASASNAQTYYWTSVDKMIDGSHVNVRIVTSNSDTAPTTTDLGKPIHINAGPFTTKGEARSSCEKTIKAVKKDGLLVKNLCSQAIPAK